MGLLSWSFLHWPDCIHLVFQSRSNVFFAFGHAKLKHICFYHCSYSKWILQRLMAPLLISVTGTSWVDFLLVISNMADNSKSLVARCTAQVFCYHIWRERNARLRDRGIFGPTKLLRGILEDIFARLHAST